MWWPNSRVTDLDQTVETAEDQNLEKINFFLIFWGNQPGWWTKIVSMVKSRDRDVDLPIIPCCTDLHDQRGSLRLSNPCQPKFNNFISGPAGITLGFLCFPSYFDRFCRGAAGTGWSAHNFDSGHQNPQRIAFRYYLSPHRVNCARNKPSESCG